MKKLMARLTCGVMNVKSKLEEMMMDEQGDTNFISIVIVLGIVVALAVIFNRQATALVNTMWGKITGNVSGLG